MNNLNLSKIIKMLGLVSFSLFMISVSMCMIGAFYAIPITSLYAVIFKIIITSCVMITSFTLILLMFKLLKIYGNN